MKLSLSSILWRSGSGPRGKTATFALENCHVHRATLDADGDTVVALTAIDPVVKVTLVPGASTLLLIRKDPDAQSFGFSYRRAFRLRGR